MIAQQQEQQPRNPSVAVAEGMDAQEVEVESRQGDQRMDGPMLHDVVPALDKLAHGSRRLRGATGAKADLAPAAGEYLDDVVFRLLVLAGVADTAAGQGMKLADGFLA